MIVPHFKQWLLRLALTCMLSPLSCVSSMTIVVIIFYLCQLQTRTLLFRISRFCYCLYFLSLTELTDCKNTSCIAKFKFIYTFFGDTAVKIVSFKTYLQNIFPFPFPEMSSPKCNLQYCKKKQIQEACAQN